MSVPPQYEPYAVAWPAVAPYDPDPHTPDPHAVAPLPDPGHVTLDGCTLRLREFTPDDTDGVLRIFGNARVTQPFGMRPFVRRQADELLAHAGATARHTPRTQYRLAVTVIGTDEVIGSVKLIMDQSPEGEIVTTGHRSAEVGVAMRADRMSVGHSVEVGYLMGVLGFRKLGLHRIWTGFLPSNAAAQGAALKSGMTCEGTLRDYCYSDTGWHDLVLFSILDDEWEACVGVLPLADVVRVSGG